MIRVRPFANALATVAAAFYIVCAILAAVAPELYLGIASAWIHGLDMSVLFPQGMRATIGSFVMGLLTLTAAAWLIGAILATLYNRQTGEVSRA